MQKLKVKQRGIGLLELMLSLAIISILLVMATRYYKSADQGQKISNAISLITGIAGAGAQYLSTHPNENIKNTAVLVDDHFLPDNFRDVKSPWGTPIKVEGKGGQVTITIEGVPGAPCRILKSSLSGAETSSCGDKDASGTLIIIY
ncbi:MAG: hypothetical protein LEGION0398_MBIBDBAK_00418 [Legionellaceae bacterium]